MLLWTILRVAFRSLLAHKLRSFLAMLGIIIGVGSVISMLALAAGARAQVMSRITAMGTNLLVVRPGQRGVHGVMSGTYVNLTLEDAQAILQAVPEVREVAPVVRGSAQVKYYGKNARANLIGSAITYFPTRNYQVEHGRMFTELETERRSHVAVLGPDTVANLFGESDPLGETVKVNGLNFRVVGVLKAKGDQGWFNPDDIVIVPFSTAMKEVLGMAHLHEIDIQTRDNVDVPAVQAAIGSVLRRRHRTQPGMPDDFYIRNQAEFQETLSEVSRTFTILLGGIASISLLVGGIGIMNIMLVTVTERTREIGIRKAVGAKDRDILRQFLLEAILMSGSGGIIGVGIGVGIAVAVNRLSTFGTIVQPSSVALALSFAAAVGIFFGYYPARRAASLHPIDALRYE